MNEDDHSEDPFPPSSQPERGVGLEGLLAKAQDQLEEAASRAGREVAVGRAGGGTVEIQINGDLQPLSVRIDPRVVEQGDVALLEDLVLAALRQALVEASAVREKAAAELLPNLDVGSLMQNLLGGTPNTGGESGLPGGIPDLSELFGGLFDAPSQDPDDPEADGDTEPA